MIAEYPNHSIDQLHDIINGLYADAWMQGHSFRYIAAIAHQIRWDIIYSAIAKNACITPASAGRPPRSIKIPQKLESLLDYRKLTFHKWCHANGYDRVEMAIGLADNERWAIERVAKDFPHIYSNVSSPLSLPPLPHRPQRGKITIESTGAQTIAEASGYPGIFGIGLNESAALYQLIGKLVVMGRILRLRHFLQHE